MIKQDKEIDFTVVTICESDISIRTLQSVINLMSKYRFVWDIGSLGSYSKTKNNKLTQFYKSKSPYLIQIDRDMVFKIEDVEIILEDLKTHEFVGAAYATRDGKIVTAWNKEDKLIEFNDKIYEVKYLSQGFSGIRWGVFHRLVNELGLPLLNEGTPLEQYPFSMDTFVNDEIMGDIWLSEDYYFCNLCRKIGVVPMLDTRIKVGHFGNMIWYPEHAAINVVKEKK